MEKFRVQRYVSKELSHFVGRGLPADDDQFDLLIRILRSGELTHPPHSTNISGNLNVNSSARISTDEMYSPEIVCFCDIPVEDLHVHAAKYSSFGLAFSKEFIARGGGAPVFYLPRGTRLRGESRELPPEERAKFMRSKDWEALFTEISLGDLFDQMMPEFHSMMELEIQRDSRFFKLFHFLQFRVFSYVKFFDESLEDDDPANYYMEREWRVVGNVQFDLNDVQRMIIPSSYARRLRVEVPDFYGQVTFAD